MSTVHSDLNTDGDITYNPPTPNGYENLYWWNVLTFGVSYRCTQIAFFAFEPTLGRSIIWFRRQHDKFVSPWQEVVVGGNFNVLYSGGASSGQTIPFNRKLSSLGWRNLYIEFYEPSYNGRDVIVIPKILFGVVCNFYHKLHFSGDDGNLEFLIDVIPGQQIGDGDMTLIWDTQYPISIVNVYVD